MNHEALGDRVRRGDPVFGAWSVLAGAVSARALAVAGLDYVVIDLQHGAATEATLAVDGVDGIYVGPRDLSLSLGCALDPHDPVLRPVLERVWSACAAAGKPAGVHATDGTTARLYLDCGCRLITVAADAVAVRRGVGLELASARGPSTP